MEKNLQNQMAANTVNASIEVAQLTKKVEEQSCNNEATVKFTGQSDAENRSAEWKPVNGPS